MSRVVLRRVVARRIVSCRGVASCRVVSRRVVSVLRMLGHVFVRFQSFRKIWKRISRISRKKLGKKMQRLPSTQNFPKNFGP